MEMNKIIKYNNMKIKELIGKFYNPKDKKLRKEILSRLSFSVFGKPLSQLSKLQRQQIINEYYRIIMSGFEHVIINYFCTLSFTGSDIDLEKADEVSKAIDHLLESAVDPPNNLKELINEFKINAEKLKNTIKKFYNYGEI